MNGRKRVLILCTSNSCRSQMAEALWRHLGGAEWVAQSAGSRPAGHVHPLAIQVLAELGLDISAQRSKSLDQYRDQSLDLVITVCDNAARDCPVFPRADRSLHWPFDDPAAAEGTEPERLAVFRRVRDEIRDRIAAWLSANPEARH